LNLLKINLLSLIAPRRILVAGLLFLFVSLSASPYTILPLTKIRDKGIILSHDPGFYAQSIQLSCQSPSTIKLFYSLTGSFPNSSNQSLANALAIDTVKSLLISLYRDGKATDTFYCGTYLIGFKSVLPVTCITIPNKDLFDPVEGIYVGGMNEDGTTFGNCWRDIGKRTFAEYYVNEKVAFTQGCELKIFGGMTRHNPEKSMRIIAKKKYGEALFNYKVFSTKDIEKFNSLVLRTSGNDYMGTRFLDVMISSLAKDINIDYMAYQPSVLFVNGEYWGIHNLREKTGLDYLKTNHHADKDSTDILLGDSYAEAGTNKHYKKLFSFFSNTSPTNPSFIDSVESKMDVDNFLKYSILQIHIVNPDYRGNIRFWRSDNLDKKFRWIYYDGDLSFANYNYNFLRDRISPVQTEWYNPTWSTFLLRSLLANQSIRNRFITYYCLYRTTVLSKESITERVQYFKKLIEPEIPRHLKRREFSQSKSNWESHVNRLIQFANIREQSSFEHLRSNFNLGSDYQFKIVFQDSAVKPNIKINNVELTSFPFNTRFFSGVDFVLSVGKVNPIYRFKGWSDGNKETRRTIHHSDSSLISLHPIYEKVDVAAHKGMYSFGIIGTGSLNSLRFIEIARSAKIQYNKLYIQNTHGDTVLEVSPSLNNDKIIVCDDTSAFRKSFPTTTLYINQSRFSSYWKESTSLYVTDSAGNILDSVYLQGDIDMIPYFVRTGNIMNGSFSKPIFFIPVSRKNFSSSNWVFATAILVLASVLFLIFYRKRKNNIGISILILLFFSTNSFSQQWTFPVKKLVDKPISLDPLLHSSLISREIPTADSCHFFMCAYPRINQPLIYIKPFKSNEVYATPMIHSYTFSQFDEFPAERIIQPRMKYSADTVRLFISGVSYKQYPLDSLQTKFLIVVSHSNGLTSWYYPIIKPIKFNPAKPGELIGLSKKGYYWQVRFMNRSFKINSLLDESSLPYSKGIYIESYVKVNVDPKLRYASFIQHYNSELIAEQQSMFNLDLEKEFEAK